MALGVTVLVGMVLYVSIWAAYRFRFARTAGGEPPSGMDRMIATIARNQWIIDTGEFTSAVPPEAMAHWHKPLSIRLIEFLDKTHLFPHAFLDGIVSTKASSMVGPALLFGELSMFGWWYYYPVAMLVKTPLATLCAMVGAAIVLLLSWRKRSDVFTRRLQRGEVVVGLPCAARDALCDGLDVIERQPRAAAFLSGLSGTVRGGGLGGIGHLAASRWKARHHSARCPAGDRVAQCLSRLHPLFQRRRGGIARGLRHPERFQHRLGPGFAAPGAGNPFIRMNCYRPGASAWSIPRITASVRCPCPADLHPPASHTGPPDPESSRSAPPTSKAPIACSGPAGKICMRRFASRNRSRCWVDRFICIGWIRNYSVSRAGSGLRSRSDAGV